MPWEGGGGAAPWSPASDSSVIRWWHALDLTAGLVSLWTDRIAAQTFVQATGAKQPTYAATSLGGRPGVTSDGARVLASTGSLSGLTAFTVSMAMLDNTTTASVALELTVNVNSNNGGLLISPNTGASPRLVASLRGAGVGNTTKYGAASLAAVTVISVGFDFATAGAGGISFIRADQSALSLTTTASASVAGSAANADLFLFGRGATPTSPWVGTVGDIVVRSGIAQDDGLARIETYLTHGGTA